MVSFESTLDCRGGFELCPLCITVEQNLLHIQCMGLQGFGMPVLSVPVSKDESIQTTQKYNLNFSPL